MVEDAEGDLTAVDDDARDRGRQGRCHRHLESGGHAQPFGHGRTDSGQVRVDDVLEVGFERGAQLQRFGSGLGRGQLRRRLRLLLLQCGPFGFESLLDLFGLLIGGVEFGFAGFDVLDPGLRLFEFGPAFGDAGLDRLDLRAIVLDAGLEVGDPLGGLRLLRDQCRTVLHRLGDRDLGGLDLLLGGAQPACQFLFALLAGLEGLARLGHGRVGLGEFVFEVFGLGPQLLGGLGFAPAQARDLREQVGAFVLGPLGQPLGAHDLRLRPGFGGPLGVEFGVE